jgi:hypothetical protein
MKIGAKQGCTTIDNNLTCIFSYVVDASRRVEIKLIGCFAREGIK